MVGVVSVEAVALGDVDVELLGDVDVELPGVVVELVWSDVLEPVELLSEPEALPETEPVPE